MRNSRVTFGIGFNVIEEISMKMLLSVGLSIFPTYQVMHDVQSKFLDHLIIQNVSPFAYYLSFYVSQTLELILYTALLYVAFLSAVILEKQTISNFTKQIMPVICFLKLLLVLTVTLFFSGFLASRPYHSSLVFFISGVLIMV